MPDAFSMGVDPTELDQRRAAVNVLVVSRVAAIRTLHRLVDDQADARAQRLVQQDRTRIINRLLHFPQALDIESPACIDQVRIVALAADPGCVAC